MQNTSLIMPWKFDDWSKVWLLLMMTSVAGMSQERMAARVIDVMTQEGLSFAHVVIKNRGGGTITNEDGYFELQLHKDDTLVVSYLGYYSTVVAWTEITHEIKLNPDTQLIDEVVVYADDDYLYEWLEKCRQQMLNRKSSMRSKAYMVVSTICNGEGVEFLEAYYNATMQSDRILDLAFKNGRSYLATHNYGGFFINFDFSRSLSLYSLLEGHDLFPGNPFQLAKSRMKKKFRLQRGKSVGGMTRIKFSPRAGDGEMFSGEIILDPARFEVVDVILTAPGKSQRVFKAFGDSVLDSLGYQAHFHFARQPEGMALSYVSIDYHAGMTSRHMNADSTRSEVKLDISSHAVLHLFDSGRSYILPFFEYRPGLNDYRLFTVPPPDERVWTNLKADNHIRLTPRQQAVQQWIADRGQMFTDTIGNRHLHFESNYTSWSLTNRLRIKRMNKLEEEGGFRRFRAEEPFLTDRLKLTVQLYLDVNVQQDHLIFTTRTLLDTYQSYNYLELNEALDDYVNLYFDIGELYRHKLEKELKGLNDLAGVKEIYQRVLKEMSAEHSLFEKDAFGGFNRKAMEKWKKRVVVR